MNVHFWNFAKSVIETVGIDNVRNGLKRAGYPSGDYLYPGEMLMSVAEINNADEIESVTVDLEVIRDYYSK